MWYSVTWSRRIISLLGILRWTVSQKSSTTNIQLESSELKQESKCGPDQTRPLNWPPSWLLWRWTPSEVKKHCYWRWGSQARDSDPELQGSNLWPSQLNSCHCSVVHSTQSRTQSLWMYKRLQTLCLSPLKKTPGRFLNATSADWILEENKALLYTSKVFMKIWEISSARFAANHFYKRKTWISIQELFMKKEKTSNVLFVTKTFLLSVIWKFT